VKYRPPDTPDPGMVKLAAALLVIGCVACLVAVAVALWKAHQ
jgi:hypothetical protein